MSLVEFFDSATALMRAYLHLSILSVGVERPESWASLSDKRDSMDFLTAARQLSLDAYKSIESPHASITSPLLSLRVFESCARLRSFKRAAEELHVTPAAVSHQIKALEEHLGVTLFRRLIRQVELTPAAELMLPKIREGLDCFAAAVDLVRPDSESGSVTVNLPPSLASRWLIHRLQDFSERYPEIQPVSAPTCRRLTAMIPASVKTRAPCARDVWIWRYASAPASTRACDPR